MQRDIPRGRPLHAAVTGGQPPLPPEAAWPVGLSRPRTRRLTRVTPPLTALLGIVLITILLAPIAPTAGPQIEGLTAFFCGALMVSEFAISLLLFVQFRETRRPAHAVLAAAYLFSALMTAPYLATFPNALTPGARLIGGGQSAAWILSGWMLGFAAAALAAMVLESRPEGDPVARARVGILQRRAITCAVAGAALVGGLGILAPEHAFALVDDRTWSGLYLAVNMATTTFLAGAIAYGVWRLPARSDLFSWLVVALAVLMASNVLAGIGGARFSFGWTLARLGAIGSACVLLGFLLSVTARRHDALGRVRDLLERRVAMRTAELSRMVAERDNLLREVYHRVKNNLQVVDSLLHLQAAQLTSADGRAALVDTRRRIHTLGIVHQQLITSHAQGPFAAAPFLADLCATLSESFGAAERGVQIRARADDVGLGLDHATPLSLIISELVANALAQGFADGRSGVVDVTLRRSGRALELTVTDDGDSGDVSTFLAGAGLGGQIVRALASQLGGDLETMRDGPRTQVVMTFATTAHA